MRQKESTQRMDAEDLDTSLQEPEESVVEEERSEGVADDLPGEASSSRQQERTSGGSDRETEADHHSSSPGHQPGSVGNGARVMKAFMAQTSPLVAAQTASTVKRHVEADPNKAARKRLKSPGRPRWLKSAVGESPSGSALVSWEKVDGAISYMVEVGNDKGFHGVYFGPQCESTIRATLAPGLHVRVRAENAIGHSEWQYT